MATDFELRNIPSRVLVRRPLDMSKLGLVRGVVVADVKRELDCTLPISEHGHFNIQSACTHT